MDQDNYNLNDQRLDSFHHRSYSQNIKNPSSLNDSYGIHLEVDQTSWFGSKSAVRGGCLNLYAFKTAEKLDYKKLKSLKLTKLKDVDEGGD